jgi:hypothetical protein
MLSNLRDSEASKPQPSLSRTCRTSRHDVLKTYYQQNTFRYYMQFCDGALLAKWLRGIPSEYRHFVKLRFPFVDGGLKRTGHRIKQRDSMMEELRCYLQWE